MTKRQEFTVATKKARWEYSSGRCEGCGVDLAGQRVEYDHDKACKDGGDNSFENCRVLCNVCHQAKTFGPDAEKFKAIRKREKRDAGIKKKSNWPCGKSSGLKRKLDGTVVKR